MLYTTTNGDQELPTLVITHNRLTMNCVKWKYMVSLKISLRCVTCDVTGQQRVLTPPWALTLHSLLPEICVVVDFVYDYLGYYYTARD
jgi:hypothetical protein